MSDLGNGLWGNNARAHSPGNVDATPPPTASDAAYTPQDVPLRGTIANDPSTFVAHGVSVNDLGSYPGGARASQIFADLSGPQLSSPARSGDGYGLRGPGTPEPMMGASKQGAILDRLDSFGVIHLGVGPAIPIILLFAIAGVAIWTRR